AKKSLSGSSVSALPDGDARMANHPSYPGDSARDTISNILGYEIPPSHLLHTLLEEYFDSVHWFSLVILERKFRSQLESACEGYVLPSQKSFLLLLSTMLGLSAWYRSKRQTPRETVDWGVWASHLLRNVEAHLFDIIDEASIQSIQICILLGSFHSYHGKPKASFALLGATIKMAQAMGLHREIPENGECELEESRRVWWTIYTWDRWASITYGRPPSIDDSEHNVEMPGEVYERRDFIVSRFDGINETICYSIYQRELNKLYVIASPLIKTIFGVRSANSTRTSPVGYSDLVASIIRKMRDWKACLPSNLVFNESSDTKISSTRKEKVFQLQSLALQLTFDHLIIIFHRPILSEQMASIANNFGTNANELEEQSSDNIPQNSTSESQYQAQERPISEQWWNAALRTARVTQSPRLTQMATDGHLMAFLAINTFNSAVALVVYAFCNPLSNRAQESKRNISRIYRLQELLRTRGLIPLQSCTILRELIRMVAQREENVMLMPSKPTRLEAIPNTEPEDQERHVTVEESHCSPGNPSNIEDIQNIPFDNAYNFPSGNVTLDEGLFSVQQVLFGTSSGALSGESPKQASHRNDIDRHAAVTLGSSNSAIEVPENSKGPVDNSMYWIWEDWNPSIFLDV
ncbi:uncharacterized protein N7477_005272, partial [Penicillium maclennaniae]|uniref:uncharacterized protein n=1 Tax=Penicillium maclennaniae TaxID=1343394 RepID=UPI0025407917